MKSFRLEDEEEIIVGDIGFKTIDQQIEECTRIRGILRNLIIAQQEQRKVWDFSSTTEKTLYILSQDVEDLCLLNDSEQEAILTKLGIIKDLIKS